MGLDTHLEAELDAYFARLTAELDASARAHGGASVQCHRIAGQTITIRCAGRRLAASLLPALQHLAQDGVDEAALDVDVFVPGSKGNELVLPAALRADPRHLPGVNDPVASLIAYCPETLPSGHTRGGCPLGSAPGWCPCLLESDSQRTVCDAS